MLLSDESDLAIDRHGDEQVWNCRGVAFNLDAQLLPRRKIHGFVRYDGVAIEMGIYGCHA